MKNKSRKQKGDYYLILIGIGFSAFYWVLESAVDSYVFRQGGFVERVFRPDPGELWMRLLIVCLFIAFGVYAKFVATERKKAGEALRWSEAKIQTLLNMWPDMTFRIGRDGTCLDFQPAKDFDPFVPPSEFLGKKVNEVLPEEIARRSMHYIEQALKTGDIQIYEYSLPIVGGGRAITKPGSLPVGKMKF